MNPERQNELARSSSAVSGTAGPVAPAQDHYAALRVLVVDDDPFMQELTSEVLAGLGVTHVRCAADGEEALSVIDDRDHRPDVIICDIAMPGMDGIVFIRHLASRDFRGAIILLSASSDRIIGAVADLVRQREMRLLGAMSKPISPKTLARLLDESMVPSVDPQESRPGAGFSAILSASEIRRGLEAGSVQISVQPKIALGSRRVVGAEALLRWRDEVRGSVSPSAVVSSAEAAGLVDELTAEVFRLAARCQVQTRSSGHNVSMSVNLSVENLASLTLPETLLTIAREAGADPRRMTLEVTESRLMGNLATSLEVLGRLSLAGFRLSMDDFGTGYSTLEKLKQLPFDELKVDRAFVSGAATDTVARTILRSSIELGHALGLTVVAEGIESRAELDLLAGLGCDEIQGYYFSRPMPAAEFPGWVVAFERDQVVRR